MTLEAKNLDTPDEKRSFEHGDLHVVNIAGATIGRAVFNPGWKWSNDVKRARALTVAGWVRWRRRSPVSPWARRTRYIVATEAR